MEILKAWAKDCIDEWNFQYSTDLKFLSGFAKNWPKRKINILEYHRWYYGFFRKTLLIFFYWLPSFFLLWPLCILAFIWNRFFRYLLIPIEVLFVTTLPQKLKPKIFWVLLGNFVFYFIYFIETMFGLLWLLSSMRNVLKWVYTKWYKWRESCIMRILEFQYIYINVEYFNYLQKKWSSDWDIDYGKKILKNIKAILHFASNTKKRFIFLLASRRIYIKFRFRTSKIRRRLKGKVWLYRLNILKLHLLNIQWWRLQIKRKWVLWRLHFEMGTFVIGLIIKSVVLTIVWPILPRFLFERLAYRFLVVESNLYYSIIVKIMKFLKKILSQRRYVKVIRFLSKREILGSFEPMPKGRRKFGVKQIRQ